MSSPVLAVVFDLDDTLFLQATYLELVLDHVADLAQERGIDRERFRASLGTVAAQGSDRGGVIDRALAEIGSTLDPAPLITGFRDFRPDQLSLLPGAAETLERLAAVVPIGCITDGDPGIQRGKLKALGLEGRFDVLVLSDELGRMHRKPDPAPFERALAELGRAPHEVVMVGDRPEKDIVGASKVGMRTVRVRTGEYRSTEHPCIPWREVAEISEVSELLLPLCQRA